MKKWVVSLLVLPVLIGICWAQQADKNSKAVLSSKVWISGRELLFETKQDPEVTSEKWYQIYVTDKKVQNGKQIYASSHPWATDKKVPCETLRYLRAWLTQADNGVNGKFSKGALNGAAGQALAVMEISRDFYAELCPSTERTCKNGDSTVKVCDDLMSLMQLAKGIDHENYKQGDTGLTGSQFY